MAEHSGEIEIKFLDGNRGKPQGDEWLLVRTDRAEWQRIHFHDYVAIFRIPGLYEYLFHDILKCQSPTVVRRLLDEELQRSGIAADKLRVMDLGAGNGLMGEELAALGVASTVGVDISPDAERAARRDRPWAYREYHVLDLARLTDEQRLMLALQDFNALTCVAATGFADIAPEAFQQAYNTIAAGSLVALTLKDEFLAHEDSSGYSRFMREISGSGAFDIRTTHRYRHRLGSGGEEYHYVAVIAWKVHDI